MICLSLCTMSTIAASAHVRVQAPHSLHTTHDYNYNDIRVIMMQITRATCGMRQPSPFLANCKCISKASYRTSISVRSHQMDCHETVQEPTYTQNRRQAVLAGLAASLISISAFPGVSYAEVDTKTEEVGLGAKIEGSNFADEPSKAVLEKLKNIVLPDAKTMISKVASGEGSNYPASIAKELETVEKEVNELIKQAEAGGNEANIKSATFGIEEQLNALKAIVGFD